MGHRFFLVGNLPAQSDQPLALSPTDLHHAVRVLRLSPGELIELVEPGGEPTEASVVSADESGVVVAVLGPIADGGSFSPRVTLFQGVAKGEKMDAIVRQAVEIGADEIIPVLTARTVVRLDEVKCVSRGDRWRRIAKSAAEQSKRSAVPSVSDPLVWGAALDALGAYEHIVTLWEGARVGGISDALGELSGVECARVALVVGPEGGLEAAEVEALEARGAITASLGPTVLRTETASIVALALAMAALGGMGGTR